MQKSLELSKIWLINLTEMLQRTERKQCKSCYDLYCKNIISVNTMEWLHYDYPQTSTFFSAILTHYNYVYKHPHITNKGIYGAHIVPPFLPKKRPQSGLCHFSPVSKSNRWLGLAISFAFLCFSHAKYRLTYMTTLHRYLKRLHIYVMSLKGERLRRTLLNI